MFFLLVNIFAIIMICLIFILINVFDQKTVKKQSSDIKLITITAFLVTLAVILDQISAFSIVIIPGLQLSLGFFALALIGFFCGGMLGLLGGIAADFLGVIIKSWGYFSFYFTFISVIKAIMPFYLTVFFIKCYDHKTINKFYLFLAFIIVYCCISLILNPIYLSSMSSTSKIEVKKRWFIFFLPRLITFIPTVTLTCILFTISYRRLGIYLEPNICIAGLQKKT